MHTIVTKIETHFKNLIVWKSQMKIKPKKIISNKQKRKKNSFVNEAQNMADPGRKESKSKNRYQNE